MDAEISSRPLQTLAVILTAMIAVWPTAVHAQRRPLRTVPARSDNNPIEDKDKDTSADDLMMGVERSVLRNLSDARELLKQERYGEAGRFLGAILEAPEDYFVRSDPKGSSVHSLKAEAYRLIGEMPSKGREAYELQYGARARQLLNEAVTTGDVQKMVQVSRQFFRTQAGYQATLLLGLDDLDHGRPLAAALTLERLRGAGPEADAFEPLLSLSMAAGWLQAGMPDSARRALTVLKGRLPKAMVTIGGREIVLTEAADPLHALQDMLGAPPVASAAKPDGWTMLRGDAARNAVSRGSAPLLNLRWRVATTDDPMIEDYLQQRAQRYRDQGASAAPGLHPLAVGDTVLMRTVRNLLAVDFATGKRVWEVPTDDQADSLLQLASVDASMQQSPNVGVGLEQRVWDDLTYGTLSSDGRYVFSIEDLGWGAGVQLSRQVIINGRRQSDPSEPKPYNRLVAHDIRTGKLKWHLGGAPDRFSLRQPEVFFLGAPLPLGGRLYVLAEVKEEIRLMILDAATGDLVWSQQLAVSERNDRSDPMRRLAGVSPSYADGILVCPTSAGALVAVETSSRWLRWRFGYQRSREALNMSNFAAIRFNMMRGGDPVDRWLDSAATIARGRVIFSPVESDEIYCLNLIDGQLKWKQRRNEDLYLAGVDEDRVVIVGRHSIRAVRLDDGQAAWPKPLPLPDGAVPSGLGFLADHTYYVPISTGAVAAVDLPSGRISRVVKSRDGSVPGNLVCYRDRIISQGVDGVESYFQVDALRNQVDQRLKDKPNDAEALTLHGELLLDDDRLEDAIAALRRSYQLDHDLRAREMLRDALLDGLRRNFARHQADAREIEALLDDPQQRATYLRLMAAGLQQTGQWHAALEHLRTMIDFDHDRRQLDSVSATLSVQRSRWIEQQLQTLRGRGGVEAMELVDRFVAENWKSAHEQSTPEVLRQFLDHFGAQPAGDTARRLLVERLHQSRGYLEAELLLARDQRSADRSRAAAAVAEMASLSRDAQRPEDAARLYQRLVQQYGDESLAGGKSARQTMESLPKDDPVRPYLVSAEAWPTGAVEVTKSSVGRPRPYTYGRLPAEYQSGRSPFFADMTMHLDQAHGMIQTRDKLGNLYWQIPLLEPGRGLRGVNYGHTAPYVASRGHLMLLQVDAKIMALDTFTASATNAPTVLWTQDLTEPDANVPFGSRVARIVRRNALAGDPFSDRGDQASALGPVTEEYVCFLRFRDCVAVHPLTGETLWVRHGIAPGSKLAGDTECVLIMPPDQNQALVLSARDGSLLGKRKIPSPDQILATFGRQFLVNRNNGSGPQRIECIDPWTRRTLWGPRKFAAESRIEVVGDEAVAAMEPDGHFVLLATADGHSIIDTKLALPPAVKEAAAQPQPAIAGAIPRPPVIAGLAVLPLGEQYIVVLSFDTANSAQTVMTQPLPGCPHRPIARGLAFGFDRQGKSIWPAPVKIENQHLVSDQPPGLPVVVFGCQIYLRRNLGPNQYVTSLLCIDKRTGRVVLREKMAQAPSTFELSGDAEKHYVDVALQPQPLLKPLTIRLTYTDKPWPATQPAEETNTSADADDGEERPWKSGILDSLWRALQPGAKPAPAVPQQAPAKPVEQAAPKAAEKPAAPPQSKDGGKTK